MCGSVVTAKIGWAKIVKGGKIVGVCLHAPKDMQQEQSARRLTFVAFSAGRKKEK
jgi:hypothetical protein